MALADIEHRPISERTGANAAARHDVPGWTAVLLAGDRPGGDALARSFGLESKALVPVSGEPMLNRVVATLLATPEIARIVILAQRPEILISEQTSWLQDEPRVCFSAGGGGISTSVAAVVGEAIAPWPVLVVTADHPLLTPEMIGEFLRKLGEGDVSVGAVERQVIMTRYPDTRRTWLRFSDGDFSGANLFALRNDKAKAALAIWSTVEQDRKQAFKMFWRFGPILALRAVTRTISLRSALDKVGRTAGLSATLVALSMPEAAIDVDKWSDLKLVERILGERESKQKS